MLMIVACVVLTNCATTEGNARAHRVFAALSKTGKQMSQSASENASIAASGREAADRAAKSSYSNVGDDEPRNTDYTCKQDCMNAGYNGQLCHKQCSY